MASKNKNKRRETSANVATVVNKIPLVSVIIPVFNSAKFIPQTLESLLYQTMQDFEVIAVDDCSTDNSVEVVESFAENFGGRLHVIKLPKNTGTPSLPRNVGIQFARGKYICFLDSDDFFTKTALEELSGLAEEYQADIVHNDNWFVLWNNERKSEDDPAMTDTKELLNPKNFTFKTDKRTPIEKEIRLETNNLGERIRRWLSWDYHWGAPSLFCSRDFLITNQITFPNVRVFEDMSFFFECLCKSKKFLRVPNITYIVRPRVGSITRGRNQTDIKNFLENCVEVLNGVFKEFCAIMDKEPFFDKNINYRYAVLDFFVNVMPLVSSTNTQSIYAQNPAFKLYDIVKKEFHPDDAALGAYLFNTFNIYRLQIMKLQHEIYAIKSRQQEQKLNGI